MSRQQQTKSRRPRRSASASASPPDMDDVIASMLRRGRSIMQRGRKKTHKNVHFDDAHVKRQKMCVPGPRVDFSKSKNLRLYEYLENITQPGVLGCHPSQYARYLRGHSSSLSSEWTDHFSEKHQTPYWLNEKTGEISLTLPEEEDVEYGKYCCTNTRASPQETLDYINLMLENLFENSSPTDFVKQINVLKYLKSKRDTFLLDKDLKDTLQLPDTYSDLDTLIHDRIHEAQAYMKHSNRPLPQGMTLPDKKKKLPHKERLRMAIAAADAAADAEK